MPSNPTDVMKIPMMANQFRFASKTYKSTSNDPRIPAYPKGMMLDGFSKNTAVILVICARKATNAMKMMDRMVVRMSAAEYSSGGGPAVVVM